jgi:hypothetical protein
VSVVVCFHDVVSEIMKRLKTVKSMAISICASLTPHWNKIYEVVKTNCSTEFRQNGTPHDDIMERLLCMRK